MAVLRQEPGDEPASKLLEIIRKNSRNFEVPDNENGINSKHNFTIYFDDPNTILNS
jgi:hypothetical protein